MRFAPLGDTAITIELGTDYEVCDRVRALTQALTEERPAGIVDVVPAYTTVTVFYDAAGGPDRETLCREIERRAMTATATGGDAARQVEIPVCYDPEFAPDLARVAGQAGLGEDAVIARHSGGSYRVRAVGFSPGFPYLDGLPEELHTPRLDTPRTVVPAGSVGIGGAQTGVYPLASPGGWNLIGRTPLALFDASATPPARLRVGDRVHFKAITREEFESW